MCAMYTFSYTQQCIASSVGRIDIQNEGQSDEMIVYGYIRSTFGENCNYFRDFIRTIIDFYSNYWIKNRGTLFMCGSDINAQLGNLMTSSFMHDEPRICKALTINTDLN